MPRSRAAGSDEANLRRTCARAGFEAGFSAVTAVVILVMLAVLGAAIVNITETRSVSVAQDVLGSRAIQAARAGIEWGAFQIRNPENTNPAPPGPYTAQYACPGLATSFALGGGLAEFTVTVQCTSTAYTEFGMLITVYQLVATSCNIPVGAAPGTCPNTTTAFNYAERQVTASMQTCRQSANGPGC
jgi:MSHA biogenesis protein MshP